MILILLFTFFTFLIISLFPPEDRMVKNTMFIVIGLILIFIAGFRGEGVDRDYNNYVEMFHQREFIVMEPSFVAVSMFIEAVFGDNPLFLFLIFAILGVSIKLIAIKKLTNLWFLSVLVYLSNFFILHEMTQIRAGIASSFLLLCIKPIYDRNLKLFLLFAILGISFHYSALVILPLWFLGNEPRRKWMFFSIPFVYLIYFSGINLIGIIPIPGVQEKIQMYQKLQEIGDQESTAINVFNLVFLAKIAIFYFLLFKYDLILYYNKYFTILIKIYCIALMVYPLLSSVPAIAVRINELYAIVDIILIPLLFYAFKPIYFSRMIVISIGFTLLLVVLFYVKLITN